MLRRLHARCSSAVGTPSVVRRVNGASSLLREVDSQRRSIATATFFENITRLQKEMASSDKKRELQHEGRVMFEKETLDDVVIASDSTKVNAPQSAGAMTAEYACQIVSIATALRIVASKSPVFQRTVEWALQPHIAATLDDVTIGRLLHAALVLSEPKIFELLFTFLWRVVELAPTLSGTPCAMILNAYGRCGVRHHVLYDALCARAKVSLLDEGVSIGHVANVANALSRVRVADKDVFKVIADQSIKFEKQAPPLVMATILDACSTVGFVDEPLFALFEGNLERQIDECGAPLMATILGALAKAKRTQSPLFAACASRASRIPHAYDPSSIARTLDAFYQVHHCAEEFFGLLAERACKVASDFRPDEIRLTLRALSAFELYDAELFPLLATRLMSIMRHNTQSIVPEDMIGTLSAFATVHERHEALVHTVSLFMKPYVPALSKELFTELLWAFAELNARNDATRAMVAHAQSHGNVLISEAERPESMSADALAKRLDAIQRVYGVSGNAK